MTSSRPRSFPVSLMQRRLWYVWNLEPENPSYTMSRALRLRGDLNVPILVRAIREIVRRHESLRTYFRFARDEPVQCVLDEFPVDIPLTDLSALDPNARERAAQDVLSEESVYLFDLSAAPPFRCRLLKLQPQEHIFLFAFHHIIADERSLGIFKGELSAMYNSYVKGERHHLPDVPLQYGDFAVWQRGAVNEEVLNRQESYWRDAWGGDVPTLELDTDHPRPRESGHRGAIARLVLPEDVRRRLETISFGLRSNEFISLVSVLNVLLHRYTGADRIIIGSPFTGRPQRLYRDTIGFFLNTVALHTDLSGNPTFKDLLHRVRTAVLGAYRNQDYPFEQLVRMINPRRVWDRHPLFQVLFVKADAAVQELPLDGLTVTAVEKEQSKSMYDLVFAVTEVPPGIELSINYSVDLFERETAERMLAHYGALIEDALIRPETQIDRLTMMREDERERVLFSFNENRSAYRYRESVHHLVEERCSATPDAVAVERGPWSMRYGELNRRSNVVARRLLGAGVGTESAVGLYLEKSPELIIGMLGILKAGGAYVPLDPGYPPAMIEFIRDKASITHAVSLRKRQPELLRYGVDVIPVDFGNEPLSQENDRNPDVRVGPGNLAYIIFTSGSTGKPKGVMVEHRGVCNLVSAQARAFGVSAGSRVLQFASPSFDASVSEVFVTLAAGATLVLPGEDEVPAGEQLLRMLLASQITVVTLPPSVLATLPEADLPSLNCLIVAGERCSAPLVDRWAPGRNFINAYGPTEATVCATIERGRPGRRDPPIGKPMENVRVYVFDGGAEVAPIRVVGEIRIGGAGISRGYLGMPALTAERFVADDTGVEPGGRLYRTGDRGRYLPDGSLEFVGRIDRQVKVRGFRVELEGVERMLGEHPLVREAAVTIKKNPLGEETVAAYVAVDGAAEPTADELREFLKRSLPEYAVPGRFVVVTNIPRTAGGKIDYPRLPAPSSERPRLSEDYDAPRTRTEDIVAGVWKAQLAVGRIGIHDDFFVLGGHSLLAIKVVSRLRSMFNTDIPLRSFFMNPTVAGLAAEIDRFLADRKHAPAAVRPGWKDARERRERIEKKVEYLRDDEVKRLLGEMLPESEDE